MDAEFSSDDERNALQDCFHNGWLHADKLKVINLSDDVGYFLPIFTSPLVCRMEAVGS
jgi:hypothetical protein